MASEAGENPPVGERPREQHLSFVQRLQRHFNPDVDPRIDLQREDDEATPKEGDSRSSTSIEDFVKRLTPTLDVGTRYEVKQEVGSGGMGTILRVWDSDLRRNLAMKVMHGRGKSSGSASDGSGSAPVDPERLGRFLEEAQITGQLDHPGVVPVHDLGIDSEGRCYFTMRFVRGRELKEVLDLAREARDGWTRTKVLAVILKVCEAMAYAHSKGVVHRDLKPANVMVGRFGETYVMDWGLARVLSRRDSHDMRLKPRLEDASALSLVRTVRRDETEQNPESPLVTMDGDVIGTPSYMAPEQARGKLEEVGAHSDVYSLGAILYYMLTGQAPYVKSGERLSPHTVLSRVLEAPPTSIEKLAPHEPAELVAICEKAMARDPSVRYLSMLEVADDIQAFLENRVVRAYERGSLAEFKKWVVRNKGMAAGLAGMFLLAVASGIGFGIQKANENESLRERQKEITAAKNEAEQNLKSAQASEKKAQENAVLADQGRRDADRLTAVANQNAERAQRSGYAANILAADYSLRLNEMAEARTSLRAANESLRGFEWRVLNLLANAPLAKVDSFSGVEALAFHPDGERVLVLTGQGHLKLRDLASQRDVGPANISAGSEFVSTILQLFTNLSFSVNPDGSRVALLSAGQNLQVFELDTGARPPGVPNAGLSGHGAKLSAVAYSPNGRLLASGDDDGQILVRDALNWQVLQRFGGHIGQITALAWSPDSTRLASSSRDSHVRVWELEDGRNRLVLRGHRGPVHALVWDVLGATLFSAGEDNSVNQWNAADGRVQRTLVGHSGPVYALAYDPEHERLASGSADRTVRLWDVATGASTVLRAHESAVKDLAFDPAGERLVTSEQSGTTYLWDASGDLATTELELHGGAVTALAFDASGKRLVSAARDYELAIWDAVSGSPLRRLRGHANMVNTAVFSPDGRTVLSGSHDKLAFLWDAETGSKLRQYGPYGDRWVQAALFSPDGGRLYITTGDKRVRVVDAQTTEVLREFPSGTGAAEAMALHPAGTQLAIVAKEFSAWILASGDSKPLFTKNVKGNCLAYSPDGKRIATGGLGVVQLWESADGAWVLDQQDQTKKVTALVFSPDGARLVSGSDDGAVHVRDALTGETLLMLRESESVSALAFSPDGARLAVGLESGRVRIHETSPAQERSVLRRAALALRERAREKVDELFATRFRLESVLEGVFQDGSLSAGEREAVLREVYLRGDDPLPLLRRSLSECIDFDHTLETYSKALARATAAEGMKASMAAVPTWELEGLLDLVLGVAAYRNARFAEAKRHLDHEVAAPRSETRAPRGLFGMRERALRLLFLCMAHCRTGDLSEAEHTWRLAQQSVLDDVELAQSPELADLLTEVETLVRSSVQPRGS